MLVPKTSFWAPADVIHGPPRDLPQQVESCYFVLIRYFFYFSCMRLLYEPDGEGTFQQQFHHGKVTLDQWLCNSCQMIKLGRQLSFTEDIDDVSFKLPWSKEYLFQNKDCFHWTVAEWSVLMGLLFFCAD